MRTYRVVGNAPFQGHGPGEEFDAELSEGQEKRAIERGSIALADGSYTPPDDETAMSQAGVQPDDDELGASESDDDEEKE